jgi:hypothetical protein
MSCGQFTPATNSDDETVLAQFCDWVGEWKAPRRKSIAGLVEQLMDRFGSKDLWQRMLPRREIALDDACDQSPEG